MRPAAPGGDSWSEGWGVGEGQAGRKGWRGARVAEGSAGRGEGPGWTYPVGGVVSEASGSWGRPVLRFSTSLGSAQPPHGSAAPEVAKPQRPRAGRRAQRLPRPAPSKLRPGVLPGGARPRPA